MSKKHYKELIGAFRVVIDELKSIKAQMTYIQAMQVTSSINTCKDCIYKNAETSTCEGNDAK